MRLTASKLRQDIYRILDGVLDSGVPVEIERNGRLLRIVPATPSGRSKLENLEPHPEFLRCDPEELVHMDWSSEWKP